MQQNEGKWFLLIFSISKKYFLCNDSEIISLMVFSRQMTAKFKVLVLNGPNLNMLGKREPEIYGNSTLEDINKEIQKYASQHDIEINFFQSNIEGEIVTRIQECQNSDGLIINAAAFTHTSVAILDALKSLNIPKIEVHISNIYKREEFRHKSMISSAVTGTICGLGTNGYILAINAMQELLKNANR